jgi:hypothetical protein
MQKNEKQKIPHYRNNLFNRFSQINILTDVETGLSFILL